MKNLQQLLRSTCLCVILTATGYVLQASSQEIEPEQQSIFELMSFQEVLQVELETNVTNLRENRRFEDYQPATLKFTDAGGQYRHWNLKVRIRGNFRRINCSEMPPLKLNFRKSELKAAGLHRFDDLKLVAYCPAERHLAYELLMREYLAYKMYNELTPNSFRVQLLRITYIDSHSGKKSRQWGFVIEDTAELRDRIRAEACDDCINTGLHEFDDEQVRLVSLFQYLIGNSDWDLRVGRNVKFVRKNGKVMAIPYDFDFSGFVNAPYAIPNPNYIMESVTDRIFLGFEQQLSQLHATIFFVTGKKNKLMQLIRQFKRLPLDSRSDLIQYMESYFKDAENIQPARAVRLSKASTYSP